jgi:hypothetical protein
VVDKNDIEKHFSPNINLKVPRNKGQLLMVGQLDKYLLVTNNNEYISNINMKYVKIFLIHL